MSCARSALPRRDPGLRLASEVELIDIRSIDDQRLAQNDFAAPNLKSSEPSRRDRRGACYELLLGGQDTRIGAKISEVSGAPQHYRLHVAVMDIWFADTRQGKADDKNVLAGCLPDRFAGARNSRRGNRHHQLYLWINLKDRLRFRKRLVPVVVAGADGRQSQSWVFVRYPFLDECDPFVLIRRA